MIIAVVGGYGNLGSHVANELLSRGHDVRILSRKAPKYKVDLITGKGLESALQGCDIVIDASNAQSKAADVLVHGSRKLLSVGEAAGIQHHICISVVGCERIPFGYFKVKAEQEKVVEESAAPWSIVRATQFHDYVGAMFDQAFRWRILPMLKMPLQTVAVNEVARTVADIAEGDPLYSRLEIAGPEIVDARELALAWKSHLGRRSFHLPIWMPGKLGKALRNGAATTANPDVRGKVNFIAWPHDNQSRDRPFP